MSDRKFTDVTYPELGDMSESISVPVGCEEIKLTQRMTNHVRYSEVVLKIQNVERDIADGGRDDPLSAIIAASYETPAGISKHDYRKALLKAVRRSVSPLAHERLLA